MFNNPPKLFKILILIFISLQHHPWRNWQLEVSLVLDVIHIVLNQFFDVFMDTELLLVLNGFKAGIANKRNLIFIGIFKIVGNYSLWTKPVVFGVFTWYKGEFKVLWDVFFVEIFEQIVHFSSCFLPFSRFFLFVLML